MSDDGATWALVEMIFPEPGSGVYVGRGVAVLVGVAVGVFVAVVVGVNVLVGVGLGPIVMNQVAMNMLPISLMPGWAERLTVSMAMWPIHI